MAVIVDFWEDKPEITHIVATIYVEKEGQKGILIGAGGAMLKRVGTLAREEMERLFGKKIFLELQVKARPNWRRLKQAASASRGGCDGGNSFQPAIAGPAAVA